MHAGGQGGMGVSKKHVKVNGGSAKIKHGIFSIAPATPPPLPINNDQSLIEKIYKENSTHMPYF